MHIKSRLAHENVTIFDLNLENIQERNSIKSHTVTIEKDGVEIKNSLVYTENLCLIQTSFSHPERDITDHFHIKGEYVKIIYLSNGGAPVITDRGQNATHVSNPGFLKLGFGRDVCLHIVMPKASETTYTIMLLSYAYFLQLMQHERWLYKTTFFQTFSSFSPTSGEVNIPILFPLHHIIKDLLRFDWKLDARLEHLKLKFKEFLLSLYFHEQQNQQIKHEISPHIMDKVKKARDFIEVHFRKTPTIKALTRQVLLNELQLKQGFKKMFGITIRSYIIELKMQEALKLIKTHKTSEVAIMLGYKSQPHFIYTFKKYYGRSPKQMLVSKNQR